jgi:hypothetical protein
MLGFALCQSVIWSIIEYFLEFAHHLRESNQWSMPFLGRVSKSWRVKIFPI